MTEEEMDEMCCRLLHKSQSNWSPGQALTSNIWNSLTDKQTCLTAVRIIMKLKISLKFTAKVKWIMNIFTIQMLR